MTCGVASGLSHRVSQARSNPTQPRQQWQGTGRKGELAMKSLEIRKKFINYYQENGHMAIKSASLIPVNDPSLLIVNSGMVPMKSYFIGQKEPPSKRVCNIQRCVRTNDIESIGDDHHLTFFEMMGNWSFGDYFKETAIQLSWKLITEVFCFDANRIYVTIFGGDQTLPKVPADLDSYRIWRDIIGIPDNRIVTLDAHSNFWGPAGDVGPCGPCTEIFFDRGEKIGCMSPTCGPNCECGRFLEIWNPGVFMQYYMHEDRSLTPLSLKSVDAGAGLERFCLVLQEVSSLYETDLFKPTVEIITKDTSLSSSSKSIRIIADHSRCATFMIADGIYPGNTKREYVLRKIIRRASLHCTLSGLDQERIKESALSVADQYSPFYPHLEISRKSIATVIEQELTTFTKTLKSSLRELERIISHSPGGITGLDAFKLHETFGFPINLTKEVAKERGLSVDEEEFQRLLEKHRQKSR